MKPIKENVVIQIEVTNACHLSCANCSRLVGHHRKPFFMSIDQIKSAISSLEGFPGRIGLMGGEPALHPDFEEICRLFIDLIPDRRRREFWTSGYKWEDFRSIREQTFDPDLVHYNDHSRPDEGWHQPVLISIDEVVEDKAKMWRLIDNCWVQRRWSASITPKGAYFCEIAAALHHALDGPDGWKMEGSWWQATPDQYQEQKQFACLRCSAALPLAQIPNNHVPRDTVSIGNLDRLAELGSPKVRSHRVVVIKKEDAVSYLNSVEEIIEGERGYLDSHPDWRPSEFRTKVYHAPGEGYLQASQVRAMQTKNSDVDATLNSKGNENIIVAEHRMRKLVITELTIKSFMNDVGHQGIMLEPLIGIEFESFAQMSRSIDDWTDSQFGTREKDVLLKYIYEESNTHDCHYSG